MLGPGGLWKRVWHSGIGDPGEAGKLSPCQVTGQLEEGEALTRRETDDKELGLWSLCRDWGFEQGNDCNPHGCLQKPSQAVGAGLGASEESRLEVIQVG